MRGGSILGGIVAFFAVGIALGYLREAVTDDSKDAQDIVGFLILVLSATAGWAVYYILEFAADRDDEKWASQIRAHTEAAQEKVRGELDEQVRAIEYGTPVESVVERLGPPESVSEHETEHQAEAHLTWGNWVLTFVNDELVSKARSS